MLYVTEVSKSELCVTMSSSLTFVKDFIDDVFEYTQKQGLPVDEFAFKFAITEAITNAIEHGNKENVRLLARFRLSFDAQSLTMVFEDEGSGFNWQERITNCPDDSAESGRGLFIIKECGYDMEFSGTGNILTLTYSFDACPTATVQGTSGSHFASAEQRSAGQNPLHFPNGGQSYRLEGAVE